VEARHLWEDADVSQVGIRIRNMHYKALILEEDPPQKAQRAIDILEKAGRVIHWHEGINDSIFIKKIDHLVKPDIQINPKTKNLRVRHVVKNGVDFYVLFNEGQKDIRFIPEFNGKGKGVLVDPYNNDVISRWFSGKAITITKHAVRILMIIKNK
jgi:hypothetical protein